MFIKRLNVIYTIIFFLRALTHARTSVRGEFFGVLEFCFGVLEFAVSVFYGVWPLKCPYFTVLTHHGPPWVCLRWLKGSVAGWGSGIHVVMSWLHGMAENTLVWCSDGRSRASAPVCGARRAKTDEGTRIS